MLYSEALKVKNEILNPKTESDLKYFEIIKSY